MNDKDNFLCRACTKKFALRFRYRMGAKIELCLACANENPASRGCAIPAREAWENEQRESQDKIDRNIPL